MKYLYIAILSFILPYCLHAQNYECFKPGQTQYFTNAVDYLRAMRIDSVKQLNNNKYYYPFRSHRGNQTHVVVTTDGGSWLGKVVASDTNGVWQFDNLTDTVFIHTWDTVGCQWVFYNDTFSRYYVAKITGIDTLTISGILDTAKTITITAIDSGTVDTADHCNGFQLILTKNHGFYQAFDLYMFPYIVANTGNIYSDYYTRLVMQARNRDYTDARDVFVFRQIDYKLPWNTEIFDYNVGDIIQYVERPHFFPATSYNSDTILVKTLNGTTVEYTIGRAASNISNVWVHGVTTIKYYGLLNAYTLLPEEGYNKEAILYNPDDTTLGYHSPTYTLLTLQKGGFQIYYIPNDQERDIYKLGLGRIYNYFQDPDYGTSFYYLKFLLKDGIHYGPNFPLSIDENLYQQTNIKIYPNPTSNYLYISTSLKNKHQYTVLITDMLGKTLRTYTCIPDEILLSDLPDGHYNLILYNADKVSSTHRFIVRR